MAIHPNELWSWDVSKLKGLAKLTCFRVYVIPHSFSPYIVGRMIGARERVESAELLAADTTQKQHTVAGTLILHAERGSSRQSKPVAELLVDLGISEEHSHPHVSDGNPYSDLLFKTLKYRPGFAARFGSIEDAQRHCQAFFRSYNAVHSRGDIAMMEPYTAQYRHDHQLTEGRAATFIAAFALHPRPFKGLAPEASAIPTAVWINPPI